ncbi:RsiV family protein [Oscillibacter sp.]|uniref:RsiV family protein n=1 Tax=Oscillibacter sp. TaxID=1945593 RepID=UPI00260C6B40|nr:RsiV family protein [Oscillibacter sp.]MDD3346686.1 RsiV family protein [Oscillibacter sp.]
MKRSLLTLHTEPYTAEREWAVEGIPVLTAAISLPQPVPAQDGVSRRIRRYYRLQCRSFLHYCENFLFPWAAAEYRAALSASAPLPHFHAELTYRVTYNESGLWSLYTQSRERTVPGQTLLNRWGDTWDLSCGYPVSLPSFFPPRTFWKKRLLALAASEIERQERAGTARYLPDWKRRLRRSFSARNYYLTDEGLSFFFPMYALAPAVEGIPAFVLPYGRDGLGRLADPPA